MSTTEDKYWLVIYHVDATGSCYIKAPTEEAARDKADESFMADSDNTELGDAVDITEVHEITMEQYKSRG